MREQGNYKTSSNFEVLSEKPLDSRMITDNYDDLDAIDNSYIGMICSVTNRSDSRFGLYILQEDSGWTSIGVRDDASANNISSNISDISNNIFQIESEIPVWSEKVDDLSSIVFDLSENVFHDVSSHYYSNIATIDLSKVIVSNNYTKLNNYYQSADLNFESRLNSIDLSLTDALDNIILNTSDFWEDRFDSSSVGNKDIYRNAASVDTAVPNSVGPEYVNTRHRVGTFAAGTEIGAIQSNNISSVISKIFYGEVLPYIVSPTYTIPNLNSQTGIIQYIRASQPDVDEGRAADGGRAAASTTVVDSGEESLLFTLIINEGSLRMDTYNGFTILHTNIIDFNSVHTYALIAEAATNSDEPDNPKVMDLTSNNNFSRSIPVANLNKIHTIDISLALNVTIFGGASTSWGNDLSSSYIEDIATTVGFNKYDDNTYVKKIPTIKLVFEENIPFLYNDSYYDESLQNLINIYNHRNTIKDDLLQSYLEESYGPMYQAYNHHEITNDNLASEIQDKLSYKSLAQDYAVLGNYSVDYDISNDYYNNINAYLEDDDGTVDYYLADNNSYQKYSTRDYSTGGDFDASVLVTAKEIVLEINSRINTKDEYYHNIPIDFDTKKVYEIIIDQAWDEYDFDTTKRLNYTNNNIKYSYIPIENTVSTDDNNFILDLSSILIWNSQVSAHYDETYLSEDFSDPTIYYVIYDPSMMDYFTINMYDPSGVYKLKDWEKNLPTDIASMETIVTENELGFTLGGEQVIYAPIYMSTGDDNSYNILTTVVEQHIRRKAVNRELLSPVPTNYTFNLTVENLLSDCSYVWRNGDTTWYYEYSTAANNFIKKNDTTTVDVTERCVIIIFNLFFTYIDIYTSYIGTYNSLYSSSNIQSRIGLSNAFVNVLNHAIRIGLSNASITSSETSTSSLPYDKLYKNQVRHCIYVPSSVFNRASTFEIHRRPINNINSAWISEITNNDILSLASQGMYKYLSPSQSYKHEWSVKGDIKDWEIRDELVKLKTGEIIPFKKFTKSKSSTGGRSYKIRMTHDVTYDNSFNVTLMNNPQIAGDFNKEELELTTCRGLYRAHVIPIPSSDGSFALNLGYTANTKFAPSDDGVALSDFSSNPSSMINHYLYQFEDDGQVSGNEDEGRNNNIQIPERLFTENMAPGTKWEVWFLHRATKTLLDEDPDTSWNAQRKTFVITYSDISGFINSADISYTFYNDEDGGYTITKLDQNITYWGDPIDMSYLMFSRKPDSVDPVGDADTDEGNGGHFNQGMALVLYAE